MIDWPTIRPAIKEQIALAAGLDVDSVVWSRSGQPYHSAAQITLLVDNVRNPGWDETSYEVEYSAASIESTAEPFAVTAGMVLDVEIDGVSDVVTFVGDASTAAEVIAEINAQIPGLASGTTTVILTSPTVADANTVSSIQVTGGSANASLGFPTTLARGDFTVPTVKGQRLFTLGVLASAISHEDDAFALTLLDKIRTRLGRDNVITALNDVNVSINDVQEARDRTFHDGEHEWSMYGFNVECGTVSTEIDSAYDGASIQSTHITGTIEQHRDGSDIIVEIDAP